MSSSGVKRNDEHVPTVNKRAKLDEPSYAFLETIDERKLDFDLEKRCSVTLSPLNCYCCLVCGKYLRGRSENTPAFLHSVNEDHHVFVNFNSLKVYLLPDNVEVEDKGRIQILARIRNAIRPSFSREEIDNSPHECFDLNNQQYTNGFVGFNNNASGNDSINVILSLLSHIIPLRDHFLLQDYLEEDEIVQRLGIIIRKLWSPKLFKPYVSSEEFLAYISVVDPNISSKVNDPRQIFIWLVNNLIKKSSELSRILSDSFQGNVQVVTIPIKPVLDAKGDVVKFQRETAHEKHSTVPFWSLTLDLPPTPLFKDNRNANDLPQVRIEELLKKFDGKQEQQFAQGLRKYKLIRLPRYLILHFNRFDKKNPLTVKGRNQTLVEFSQKIEFQNSRYTLVANVVHDTIGTTAFDNDDKSVWRIQLLNPTNDQWVELDGTLNRLKERELLFLQETYMQVWRREDSIE
ncbi:hypothetical protein ZYGR_0S00930 [Zygosaccharomyces rouxii]|uniref:ZYRO0F04554p n=2 Tax=Zygosaccharomyces rouxii TaxID=4956 RepID=C5DXF2_ZYGRC|nr:uncharacterized protein ZYRO0F04554g [Zygosaccharomyces rouxii]KAH9199226.1 hypothetical protein LQ764DRAFT_127948 [Zygosaccharomyces rouxii]GAV49960.1 hypothetical protein ZYGR_0S00930 [Zygosaccharomyces rouxii]CAR28463.1 ZYRO0F04554p [Zygosaccharomyces rouxii]